MIGEHFDDHRQVIDPCPVEEMQRVISDFAMDEWNRRKNEALLFDDDQDQNLTPREVRRVIRNMTNTREKYRTVVVKGKKKQNTIDPIDELIEKHDSVGSFINHMVERADLLSRMDREWWWADDDDGLAAMKQRFDEVNHGEMPTATLPQAITLVVPTPLPGSGLNLDLELIDTRGFDGHLDTRGDIQAVLRDPRCMIVSCTSFKDAPSEGLKSLLKAISADATLRSSTDRMLLVLMDHDDSEQVNGADGDRDRGQDIKVRECAHALESLGHTAVSREDSLMAFDAIQDPRELLLHAVDERLSAMRDAALQALETEVQDATSFLANLEDQKVELARAHVDREVLLTIQANQPTGAPLRDPVEGLYEGISACRYASQVQASNRRNGRYPAMDAYAAIRAGAARAVTAWLNDFAVAVRARFNALAADPELVDVADHLRLRQSQFEQGLIEAVDHYAVEVRNEVEASLENDDEVWTQCADEWGRGSGFKDRVMSRLRVWSRHQTSLQAHEAAQPTAILPLSAPDDG